MKLKLWQVDAFASEPLEGNPAAIVPLDSWLDAGLMQRIAAENNVSETAYFVKTGAGAYDLRWFTPALEVDLCGHATLASAWVLFNVLQLITPRCFQCHLPELVLEVGKFFAVLAHFCPPCVAFFGELCNVCCNHRSNFLEVREYMLLLRFGEGGLASETISNLTHFFYKCSVFEKMLLKDQAVFVYYLQLKAH